MFDIDPVVWLQSLASPALTAAMNGISLLGYTRAHVALAALLAFGCRMRAAVPLLVLVALNVAFTDIAKTTAATPRPDADSRVEALSQFAEEVGQRAAHAPADVDDSPGFPSGHVSATTTFALGLAWLLEARRRGWLFAWAAVAAMAVSRMYLGRHYLGDVLGGVAIGGAVLAFGFAILKVAELAGSPVQARRPIRRIAITAFVLVLTALLASLPDAGDAGRLLGMALGVAFLFPRDVFAAIGSLRSRVVMVILSAAGFAVAWAVMSRVTSHAALSDVDALRLAASAVPNAAFLIVPAMWSERARQLRQAV